MSRPEHLSGGATSHYTTKAAAQYQSNNRMRQVQMELSKRALELMGIPAGLSYLILDIGCGGGFSHEPFLRNGHVCVGMDINRTMLNNAVAAPRRRQKRQRGGGDDGGGGSGEATITTTTPEGYGCADVLESDMGDGLGFRRNIFDGAISISALQWLCYPSGRHKAGGGAKAKARPEKKGGAKATAKKGKKGGEKEERPAARPSLPLHIVHSPEHRLHRFFLSLRKCLRKNAKAVLQFYPETHDDAVQVCGAAHQVGFRGGLVVDYPTHANGKKYFLVLTYNGEKVRDVGPGASVAAVAAAVGRFSGGGTGTTRTSSRTDASLESRTRSESGSLTSRSGGGNKRYFKKQII